MPFPQLEIEVVEGTIAEAFDSYLRIPEFEDTGQVSLAEMERRLAGPCSLILIARSGTDGVGFKLGYDRFQDGSFYSWLGGVAPAYRRRGVALALLEAQERRVRELGFGRIYVKTRNRFAGMRAMLARSGYQIVSLSRPSRRVAQTGSSPMPISELSLMHLKEL